LLLYVPVLNGVFKTVGLDGKALIAAAVISLSSLAVLEASKGMARFTTRK
jgi:hypothetical protein